MQGSGQTNQLPEQGDNGVTVEQVWTLYFELSQKDRETLLVRILDATPITMVVGGSNPESLTVCAQSDTNKLLATITDQRPEEIIG
jgi:hypothetical protein